METRKKYMEQEELTGKNQSERQYECIGSLGRVSWKAFMKKHYAWNWRRQGLSLCVK